jgi:cyanate lyase
MRVRPGRNARSLIMKREELAEKILDIKREKGWSWKHVCGEIGGMSPILVVGALLGHEAAEAAR